MSKQNDVMQYSETVEGPPVKVFIRDSGGVVTEPCVLVGHVVMDEARRPYLDDLGINTSWAEYDRALGRWERCLMSEAVADMLESMSAEGHFPFSFEAGPSLAELAWLKAQAAGETERPELPLHQYLIPATAEALDEVATLTLGSAHRFTRGSRAPGSPTDES